MVLKLKVVPEDKDELCSPVELLVTSITENVLEPKLNELGFTLTEIYDALLGKPGSENKILFCESKFEVLCEEISATISKWLAQYLTGIDYTDLETACLNLKDD